MTTTLIRGLYNAIPRRQGVIATIGNFDGVHVGHQALLAKVNDEAKKQGKESWVITFEPQPLEFFSNSPSVPRLTRFREKFYQIAECGIDKVWVIGFNAEFAALSAEAFMQEYLCSYLGVSHLVVGDDFQFGQKREGDVSVLKKRGEQLGFSVETMPSVLVDHERVSSTRIRQALAEANHPLAERLLGRPYSMMGRVVYGDQLGRSLGFPTANIHLHRRMSPVLGVYAVRLHGISKKGLPGVANVGIRPTIGGTHALLEVYVFDFDQTIYGRYVSVEFCQKIRDEKRFDSIDQLKEKMGEDAVIARQFFENTVK